MCHLELRICQLRGWLPAPPSPSAAPNTSNVTPSHSARAKFQVFFTLFGQRILPARPFIDQTSACLANCRQLRAVYNSSPGGIRQPIDRIDALKSVRLDVFITAPRRTHAERGRWMFSSCWWMWNNELNVIMSYKVSLYLVLFISVIDNFKHIVSFLLPWMSLSSFVFITNMTQFEFGTSNKTNQGPLTRFL